MKKRYTRKRKFKSTLTRKDLVKIINELAGTFLQFTQLSNRYHDHFFGRYCNPGALELATNEYVERISYGIIRKPKKLPEMTPSQKAAGKAYKNRLKKLAERK